MSFFFFKPLIERLFPFDPSLSHVKLNGAVKEFPQMRLA